MSRTPQALTDPLINRGTAFMLEERVKLGLVGRLPSAVETLDQQAARAYAQLSKLPLGQSSTDTFPTAVHIATIAMFVGDLIPAVQSLREAALASGYITGVKVDQVVDPKKMVGPR